MQANSFETVNGSWPAGNYQLHIEHDEAKEQYQYHGYLPYLKLEETLPLLTASSLLPTEHKPALDTISTQGILTQTRFSLIPNIDTKYTYRFSTDFKELSIAGNAEDFILNDIDGSVNVDNGLIKLQLHDQAAQIKIGSLFNKPFTLEKIDSDVEFRYQTSEKKRITHGQQQ